jgi:hypothetical protein
VQQGKIKFLFFLLYFFLSLSLSLPRVLYQNNTTTEQKKVINLGSRQIKMIKSTCNLLDEKRNEQLHIHVNEMINLG